METATINTTAIRTKISQYMEVGFTMKEAFDNMRWDRKTSGRKYSIVAEARAKAEEATGTYQYGWDGKSYGNNKWGNQ